MKQEQIALIKQSLIFGVIFFIVFSLMSNFTSFKAAWFEIIVISVVAACFLYVMNYLTLKRTKAKNTK